MFNVASLPTFSSWKWCVYVCKELCFASHRVVWGIGHFKGALEECIVSSHSSSHFGECTGSGDKLVVAWGSNCLRRCFTRDTHTHTQVHALTFQNWHVNKLKRIPHTKQLWNLWYPLLKQPSCFLHKHIIYDGRQAEKIGQVHAHKMILL